MDTTSGSRRILALAGALQPVWFLGGSVVFGALRPGYDASHAISELGQQGSSYAVLWNVAGFGGSALLYGLFAFAMRSALGGGWLFRVIALQALFIAASGTFGCDPGCPPVMSSWQGWAHSAVGLVYFAVTCVAPLVAWRAFRARVEWQSLAPMSLTAGVVLLGSFFSGPFLFGAELVGFWQRLTLAIAGSWAALIALHLWRIPSGVTDAGQTSDRVQARTALG